MERTWAGSASGDSAPLRPPSTPEEKLAGRYRLERKLRERAGTVTWQAFDDVLSRTVIAHVMEPDSTAAAAVLSAARKSALATDSRFLRVLDAMDGDTPFVICESVIGVRLQELLTRGALTSLESAHIVREIADALAPMHTQGVFHRRLDPQNVTITRSGNVKISGFLIDAALNARAPEPAPSWREQEAADVRAMGKLLYACLVARWPIDLDLEQTRQWGLLAAPLTSPAVSGERRWVPPATLSSRVSAPLDAICMQILSPRPGSEALRTAEEVDTALARVLGSAAADDQLEHRVALLIGSQTTQGAPGEQIAHPVSGSPGVRIGPDEPAPAAVRTPATPGVPGRTSTMSSVGAPSATLRTDAVRTGTASETTLPSKAVPAGARPANPVSANPVSSNAVSSNAVPRTMGTRGLRAPGPRAPRSADATPTRTMGAVGGPQPARAPIRPMGRPGGWHPDVEQESPRIPARTNRRTPSEPSRAFRLGRWLIPLFVVVMVVVSVTGMLRSCGSSLAAWPTTSQRSHGGSATTSAASAPLAAAPNSVTEFDPVADGGEGREMPTEIPLATDGKPSTAWHTQEYWNSAAMGGLKPGTGLLLEYSALSTVKAVQLSLVGAPTGVQLMVPVDEANPSTTSVKDWKVVASEAAAPTTVTLTPEAPLTTRHLLVYITSLPKLSNGHYQAGIAEIKVNP
ncbi:MAG: hypothetical protein WAX29_04445 [Propionibacterium sp.]